jgi:hypothetical protein
MKAGPGVVKSRTDFDYWLDDRLQFPAVAEMFLVATISRPALAATQPIVLFLKEAVSSGVKRPGRDAKPSLPSSAEIKNT